MATLDAPAPPRTATHLIAVAWAAMVLLALPSILFRELTGSAPPWLMPAQLAVLGGFIAVALAWRPLRPLWGFLIALLGLGVGEHLKDLILGSTAWNEWARQASWGVVAVADKSLRLIGVALMAVTLIGSGLRRRDLFLTKGDPAAIAQPTRMLGQDRPEPWTRVVRSFLPVFVLILVVVLALMIRPSLSNAGRAVALLPAVILAAAVNAFQEEFRCRCVFLARLLPVIGVSQALWITAAGFGLGHFYGNPSGLVGVVLAGWLGWVLGKSMVETGGLVWAFLIHFIGDFVIYLFQAMAQA